MAMINILRVLTLAGPRIADAAAIKAVCVKLCTVEMIDLNRDGGWVGCGRGSCGQSVSLTWLHMLNKQVALQ